MSIVLVEKGSNNFDQRGIDVAVDMLVFHYTGMETAKKALNWLTDDNSKVSAHYLVDETGQIFKLVPEEERAWHAGVASWRGVHDVNARSIGIEIVNPGHEHGYKCFPLDQMVAVLELSKDIISRYLIPARNILAHSDVAPARKIDPGELFNWKWLAREGVGLWPKKVKIKEIRKATLVQNLSDIGYDVSNIRATIEAFQRRYRPQLITGKLDFETASLISGLLEAIQN